MSPRKSVSPQPAAQSTSEVNLQTVIKSLQEQLLAVEAARDSALEDSSKARRLCRDALDKMMDTKHQGDAVRAELVKTAMACDKLIAEITELDKSEKETRAHAKRLLDQNQAGQKELDKVQDELGRVGRTLEETLKEKTRLEGEEVLFTRANEALANANKALTDQLYPQTREASLMAGLKIGNDRVQVGMGVLAQKDFNSSAHAVTRPTITFEYFPVSPTTGFFIGGGFRRKHYSVGYEQSGLFTKHRAVATHVGYQKVKIATAVQNPHAILALGELGQHVYQRDFRFGLQPIVAQLPTRSKLAFEVQGFIPKPVPSQAHEPSEGVNPSKRAAVSSAPVTSRFEQASRVDTPALSGARIGIAPAPSTTPQPPRYGAQPALLLAIGAVFIGLAAYWRKSRMK